MALNLNALNDAFKDALTDQDVRLMQAIQAMLGLGVLLFAVIALALAVSLSVPPDDLAAGTPGGAAEILSLTNMLSLVHALLAVSTIPMGLILYNFFIRKKAAAGLEAIDSDTPPEEVEQCMKTCLAMIRQAVIIRLALFEGPAFFGIVVFLLGGIEGIAMDAPLLWLNLVTPLIMLVLVAATFPSRQRLEDLFRYKILASYELQRA